MDWKNWWDYHKWYVILGLFLAVFLVRRVGFALGLFGVKSDVQAAYVGRNPLPEGVKEAIEAALASLAEDYNGDGKVKAELHSYPEGLGEEGGDEGLTYRYGMEVALLGDIEDCDSYLFLLEDPEGFQLNYQLLAMPDGNPPEGRDVSIEGKGALWGEIPALAEQDLGLYEENVLGNVSLGDCQEYLAGLFVGRRCFPGRGRCRNLEGCEALWERLMRGSE